MTLILLNLIFVLGGEKQSFHPSIHDSRGKSSQKEIASDHAFCDGSRDVVVGTRFWAQSPRDLERLDNFIKNTENAVGSRLCSLLITINADEDNEDAATLRHLQDVSAISNPLVQAWEIRPWSITTPLNSILHHAKKLGSTFVLFLSVEIELDAVHFAAVMNEFSNVSSRSNSTSSRRSITTSVAVPTTATTMVAGVALRGHRNMERQLRASSSSSSSSPRRRRKPTYNKEKNKNPKIPTKICGHWGNIKTTTTTGERGRMSSTSIRSEIDGDTVPWNTFAVWRVNMLATLGFLEDANLQDPPGMEEPVPIAILQERYGQNQAQAKLIHFSEEYKPMWKVRFESDERRLKQARKMASKKLRTQNQLRAAGNKQGTIIHKFAECID
mmetsp:Transcript_32454/g.52740  ORF Transcript_32454/g.52740 Transcript_32454/m.52740 type:complete len:385 (+) Transcript_32454:3-1157(+)